MNGEASKCSRKLRPKDLHRFSYKNWLFAAEFSSLILRISQIQNCISWPLCSGGKVDWIKVHFFWGRKSWRSLTGVHAKPWHFDPVQCEVPGFVGPSDFRRSGAFCIFGDPNKTQRHFWVRPVLWMDSKNRKYDWLTTEYWSIINIILN